MPQRVSLSQKGERMNCQQLFLSLSHEDKNKFCSSLTTLGLVNELNSKRFNKVLKTLVNTSSGRLKKLYKTIRFAEQKIGRASLNNFFDAVAQEG